ncbi:DUF2550 domain-containing protein [Gleimia sp. 6138-11-ORH1]|uniref:DUF2550 domain-containing protein n=1 Tax=Gleimia sp. 6138-11-ORH1 TaxID=2973937 RepID=UPI0021695D39|nr:DUF2550 domain-containing protein [Gleimia sp. 6138-11-ORH1]MCS4484102.1 DUF2550 domain-containing protein [Gleimia sp. 6138-11-ORH1]
MDFMITVFSVLLFLVLVVAVVGLYLVLRIRHIGNIVGTFECWIRDKQTDTWTSGMARFKEDELQWFRLVGFRPTPQIRLPRRGMVISVPQNFGNSPYVEIVIEANGQKIYCTMATQWYNGLVSWVESEAPQPRKLF